ncbi:MAG: phosphatase PAP2 family protein [Chloroflexi bacterium]|nr:phosphatase PAP2 family protein [Chloroflexota bacterium]
MPAQKGKKPVEKIKEGAHKAARAETAPAPVRRYRAVLFLVLLLIITAAFAVLTFLVKTTPSFPLDLQITLGIQSINIPVFGGLMTAVSWLGFSPQSVIITALIILLILGFGLQWEALAALIAALLSIGINVVVKDLIQRPRPAAALVHVLATLNDYSFPSGHVMFYTGFYGFIVFLSFTLLKPSLKRTLLLVFFGLLVLLVGVSRIYVGEHWASDVLGAYLLGTLTLVAFIQLYRWGKPRFFVHQPVAKAESSKA